MKTTLKIGLIIALGLSINAIGCGDDSGEEPYCRDGSCGGDGGAGGGSGSNCNNACQSPTVCNTSTNQCTYSNNECAACGAGTYCDTSTTPDSCKPNNNPGNCGNNCGPGTTCMNGACVPGSGGGGSGGGGNCNNACGAGTYCSNGVCVPSGSGGSGGDGGTGGGTGGNKVDVTFIPTLGNTLGYVVAQNTSDGAFNPQTDKVTVTNADGVTAVCAKLYGASNKLNCNGLVSGSSVSCRYLNALKNVLGPKHGQSSDPLASYFGTQQALIDAASDLVACASSSYSSCIFVSNGDGKEFKHRCDLTNNTCQDNDPVGDAQFQIACALVGK